MPRLIQLLLAVSGLPTFLLTAFLVRVGPNTNADFDRVFRDTNGKFRVTLAEWASGRTDTCKGFDLIFWGWIVSLLLIAMFKLTGLL